MKKKESLARQTNEKKMRRKGEEKDQGEGDSLAGVRKEGRLTFRTLMRRTNLNGASWGGREGLSEGRLRAPVRRE